MLERTFLNVDELRTKNMFIATSQNLQFKTKRNTRTGGYFDERIDNSLVMIS